MQNPMQQAAPDDARSTRLMRGILDACLLALLTHRDRYGFELAGVLRTAGLPIVKDGSIYPLLARLESRRLVSSYRGPSAGAAPRRYYRITADGRAELDRAQVTWTRVVEGVDRVLGLNDNEEQQDE